MVDIPRPPDGIISATCWNELYSDQRWQEYRKDMIKYILENVCSVNRLCKKTGSDKPTSDVDITIIDATQISDILEHLQNTLLKSFQGIALSGNFQNEIPNLCMTSNGSTRCERDQMYLKISRLLDINVYYTNFEVSIEGKRFHIIDHETSHIQRYYAYNAWPQQRPHDMIQDPCLKDCDIEHYKTKSRLQDKKTANNLINCISKWSTEQRDAYVTQGSYYRWVLDMPYDQLKYWPWILKDCMIEQVCMAHKALFSSKRQDLLGCFKYLSRAYNTLGSPLDFVFIDETTSRNLKRFLELKANGASTDYNSIISNLKQRFNTATNIEVAMLEFIAYINEKYTGDAYDHHPLHISCPDSPQELKKFSEMFGVITPNQSFVQQNAGTTKNPEYLTLLGRRRRVYTYSRKKYVNIRGKLVTVREAREIERQIRNQKKQHKQHNKTNARL